MIDKPTTATSSTDDVSRVGGEDDSRSSTIDARAGYDADSRESVDDQPRGASPAEKS